MRLTFELDGAATVRCSSQDVHMLVAEFSAVHAPRLPVRLGERLLERGVALDADMADMIPAPRRE